MSLTDSFAILGQQFQQALLSIYQPQVGGQTSLVFVPGGVPVATSDGLTEPGPSGQLMVNPAQLTSWLETVVDSPLQVDIPDATLLGSTVTLVSMSAILQTITQFAAPYANPGTPEATRVAEEISSAAANVGPGVLPISTVPSDWPLPGSTDWNTFDSQQVTQTGTQPQGGGAQPPSTPPPYPRIWQLRELPQLSVMAPAAALPAADQARIPAADQARIDVPALDLPAGSAVAVEPANSVQAGPPYLAVARAFSSGLVFRPPVATSETVSVTMSVEHTVATVNRSPWWQGSLIADPGWYVPGIERGWYVGEPADPVNQPYALPVAIVLARNLSISGTWSSDDAASLVSSGVTFGPFGLGTAEITSTSQVTTISVPGVSLIAMFCEPLPVLPPNDPPSATGTVPADGQGTAASPGASTGGTAAGQPAANGAPATVSTQAPPPVPAPGPASGATSVPSASGSALGTGQSATGGS
jgi:hypothetical protein